MLNTKITAEQVSDLHGWINDRTTQALLRYLTTEQERALSTAVNLRTESNTLLLRSKLEAAANLKKILADIQSGEFVINPT